MILEGISKEHFQLNISKCEGAQWGVPSPGFGGGNTNGHGYGFRDETIIGQCRLAAHIGTMHHSVCDREWVRFYLLIGRRKGIEPPFQLQNTPSFRPARQLPADVVGINISSQEQTRIEKGLITDNFKQSSKFHAFILPLMVNYGNGIGKRYTGKRSGGVGGRCVNFVHIGAREEGGKGSGYCP